MSNMPSTPRQQRAAAAGSPRNAPLTAPMSERQQMALLMQMTSQDKPTTPPINPGEERRRNRQQRNERGETPLHLAAKKGDQEQVQKLLEQGMKPDVTDFAGWTPLHEACSFGWSQIVETLVGAGANVNARGLDDDTPLHDAASTGNLQMVQFLVEHGADPCAKNNQGKMPSDFASEPIYNYLVSVKESAGTPRGPHPIRARDDNSKKGNASTTDNKRIMEGVGPEGFENKDSAGATEKTSTAGESKDEGQTSLSSGVVSSTQDDNATSNTSRQFFDSETGEGDEDEASKRKKRKEEPVKEAPKPVQPSRGTAGRVLTGTKPPGPASKTGAVPLGKASQGASVPKPASNAATKSTVQAQSKGAGCGPAAGKSGAAQGPHPGKSTGVSKGGSAAVAPGKGPERKSPEDTPKLNPAKETMETDSEETKTQESSGPKVPPLKIVIPGGVGGSTSSGGQQEGEGSGGRSGGSKGRHSVTSLPYIIPCTATDGQDSPDSDEKKAQGDEKRVLRSHRSHDEKDKDDRTSPQSNPPCPAPPPTPVTATDTPTPPPARPATTTQDEHPTTTTTATTSASTTSSSSSSTWSGQSSNDFHPRKRKIKASKESLREPKLEQSASECAPPASTEPVTQHSNPYQLFIDIRKQIERRQKGLFPVQPKPPQGFKDYLMNRGTYLLQRNIKPMPQVTPPVSLSALMRDQYMKHEKERHNLRIQHIIEKEKLVLCVEQEILRVHGRAARALANQALPFSACTILRDNEVYNAITPEQEEKERNAQRSRYNGRLFLSWLQDVDDKWEKIKEGMVRRHHLEAETLHSVQKMQWEWKLKEHGLCDHKTTAKIDTAHVPQVHVSDDFDLLPA